MWRPEPRKSFRTLVSEHIVASLISCVADQAPEQKGNNVLVVDEFALSVLNASVSLNELLKVGFITVCPFETKKELADGKRRRRYEHLDVLYYMRPRKSNLARVIADYEQPGEAPEPDTCERCFPFLFRGLAAPDETEPPMYADCRLLLIPGPAQSQRVSNADLAFSWLESQVATRGRALERLKSAWRRDGPTRECVPEIMAYEQSLFSLDMPATVSSVYTAQLRGERLEGRDLEEAREAVFDHLDVIAYRVATACVTMNELPYIRYAASSRGIAEVVARTLAKSLKAYRDEHPSFRPWGDAARAAGDGEEGRYGPGARAAPRPGEPPEPATVLIVDRVDDIAPALLHDITYASLVCDVLGHVPATPFRYAPRGKAGGGGGGAGGGTGLADAATSAERDVMLDDSDPVWRMLRHEDMGAAIDTIDDGVRCANARQAARAQLDPQDVNDLRELMAAVTGDEKLVDEKFSQHYRMKGQIVDAFEKRNVHEVATLEQLLVTGCDADGAKPNAKEVERVVRGLMQDDRLTHEDQARVLMLFILCAKSVEPSVRNELLALSRVTPRQQTALLNLVNLHVPTTRKASEPRSESAPFHDEDTLKRNRKAAEGSHKLCRYVSKLEDVVDHTIRGTLSEEQYPWVRAPPGVGGGAGGGKAGGKAAAGGGKGGAAGGAGGKEDAAAAAIAAGVPKEVLDRAAHGQVLPRFAGEVLALSDAERAKVQGRRKLKAGRFADASGDGGGGGGGSGGGAGGGAGGAAAGADAPDTFARALDPIKPRAYVGGRIIVFVVGGLTQMEVAAMERLSRESGREIVAGGTSLLTPRDFISELYATDPEVDDSPAGGGAPRPGGKQAAGGGGGAFDFPGLEEKFV